MKNRQVISMMALCLAALMLCSCASIQKKKAAEMQVRDFFTLQDGRVAKL